MSTTVTLSMAPAVGSASCCPNCGVGLPAHSSMAAEAQKQIEDLQAQVRLLNEKATAAGTSVFFSPKLPC
jgi:DNA repair exonuclease SbcCD ATPase subunit